MLSNPLINLLLFVLGSACSAAGLIDVSSVQPYGKALAAFGAALLAVARWDQLKPSHVKAFFGPMTIIVAASAVALLSIGCPSACRQLPTTDEVKDCAVESAKSSFYDAVPRARTILASGATMDAISEELARLAVKYGKNVVICVVQKIGGEAGSSLEHYPDDPINQRVKANAEAWLAQQGAL